ncbi:MAG TPA: uL15 family ribosomal protein [Nitrososphaerales archaeon]|nr:uL15 family ribosomal protein [Nitrososphaerales archaeon]
MASRLRKVRRLRGSRTHGWGQIGQHRRTGAKGGSGMAGMHKHKWSYTVKYAPDHFGSNKWHPPNRTITDRWINLNQLGNLAGSGNELDLASLGYDKLLGQGTVHLALKVRVPRASSTAIEKIKAAGGSVEVLEPTVKVEKQVAKPPEKGQKPSQKNKSA